ncbi:hypothetical protein Anapl_10484 [Anas platyrhynchos]|uniref:Uncharacterized protein n=1 Tax=Anas platyrhynchos TaxID=8839 RepID=R0KXH6_ANAPL|nr:hypothetical protein Anapl_10484 [Anas platyrhynchos]
MDDYCNLHFRHLGQTGPQRVTVKAGAINNSPVTMDLIFKRMDLMERMCCACFFSLHPVDFLRLCNFAKYQAGGESHSKGENLDSKQAYATMAK